MGTTSTVASRALSAGLPLADTPQPVGNRRVHFVMVTNGIAECRRATRHEDSEYIYFAAPTDSASFT